MKDVRNKELLSGISLLAAFAVWTILIRFVDVQNVGPGGTAVGFAALNVWFHRLTGVHMLIYTITDWLSLVPIIICVCFGILGYLLFEMAPINYRPILIDGNLEASYPSSTTLLVLSVMPTLKYQAERRIRNTAAQQSIAAFVFAFSAFMVIGRLISGVHWATDILGSVFLSFGLYMIYHFMAEHAGHKKPHRQSEVSDGVQ